MPAWARTPAIVILVAVIDGYAARHFLMGVSISQWTSGEWTVFGIIFVTLVLTAALVIFEIDKRFWLPRREQRKRKEELTYLVDIEFLIPPSSQRIIQYAKQDEHEHLVREIVLQPLKSTIIEIRIHPRTRFISSALLLGCYHDDRDPVAKGIKPQPAKLLDVYGQGLIERNAIANHTPGHIINARAQYRWNKDIRWGATTIIIGVQINTFAEGVFTWQSYFITDEGSITKELTIRVEETQKADLICVAGDHSRHKIEAAFKGTPWKG